MADREINALTNQEVVKQGNNELRRTVQHLPSFIEQIRIKDFSLAH